MQNLWSQTIKIDSSARPWLFENAFLNDSSFIDSSTFDKFYTIDLGKIKVESGKIIVCDPLEMHVAKAFPETFPKGEFPVQLAINNDGTINPIEVIAYCRIKFSNKSVKKWLLASTPKGLTTSNEFYAGGIGTGICVLIDSLTNEAFIKQPHKYWGNLFVNKFNDTVIQGKIDKLNGHSFVSYNGFDGTSFKVYIGMDAKGHICRLLIDGGMYFLHKSKY